VVESDESTSNFDPEFTSADIRDVGFAEAEMDQDYLDEEDPSEDWTSHSMTGSGFLHTPNGPLGSDRDPNRAGITTPISPNPAGLNGHSTGRHGGGISALTPMQKNASKTQGIQIMSKKKRKDYNLGSPLTNSVQENFRGFTYHGGESMGMLAPALRKDDEEAVDDEEVPEVTTDDEYEDSETAAGRYANARRKGHKLDDDDMR
jgi:hypothetical protein